MLYSVYKGVIHMNNKEFLELSIDKQIEYLNTKLAEGQTVIRIREDIGIGEKKLQKVVKEHGYKYSQKERRYIKDSIIHKVIHEVIQNEANENNEVIQSSTIIEVMQEDKPIIQNDNMKYLNDNFEVFKAMIERFKLGQEQQSTSNIIINLQDDSHIKRPPRPVRVNAFVEDQWKQFCEDNKRFTKKELLSMALKTYMEKYSK